jgi:hypothetical protein
MWVIQTRWAANLKIHTVAGVDVQQTHQNSKLLNTKEIFLLKILALL